MKNLLIILAIILPIALSGQTETATQTTPEKKNTITASTFLGSTSGLAIDYRRGFSKNREFIIGANTSFSGARSLNIGFRKYYNTSNKLSIGFGLDAGLKNRQIIGDNFFTRAVEKTFMKVGLKYKF